MLKVKNSEKTFAFNVDIFSVIFLPSFNLEKKLKNDIIYFI